MSEAEPKPKPSSASLPPAFNAQILGGMMEKLIDNLFEFAITLVKAGETDLIEGYAGAIIGADLFHSAGLLSGPAYDAIFTLETILAGTSALGNIVSSLSGAASPFAPSLKTRIEMKGQRENYE